MAGARVNPNVGRTLETGAILGILTLFLAFTGLLLSPTFMTSVGGVAAEQGRSNSLYVAHLTAAVLLVGFTLWHLVPFAYSLLKKAGQTMTQRGASFTLLALVIIEIITGYELWAHQYVPLPKATAVLVHLAVTFILLVPLAIHTFRGLSVWNTRRLSRMEALAAATAVGRREQAESLQRSVSRRLFLRLAAYAVASLAIASAIGTAAKRQLQAWRVNSIGATPALTKENYRLKVTGLVNKPITLTFDELTALPSRELAFTHHCVEGWTYSDTFTGVSLSHVIRLAGGAKSGAAMLILKSPETSRSMFSFGEAYTTNFPYEDALHEDVLLVFAAGGKDLPPIHGFPVRLMTPRKWGYKSCKWLTEIEVSADRDYHGYWEKRGYHNDGDYPGPIFANR